VVDLHHFCWTPNYLSLSRMVLGDTLMFLYNISDWTYKCCCRYTQWLLTIIYFAVGYPINCHKLIVIVLKCCWTLPPFLWTRYLPIHYHILLLDTQYIFIFKKTWQHYHLWRNLLCIYIYISLYIYHYLAIPSRLMLFFESDLDLGDSTREPLGPLNESKRMVPTVER
jgi:hypothetical protein